MTDKKICKNNKLTGIAALYFLGVFVGTVLYSFTPLEHAELFKPAVDNFISGRFNKEFSEILINSFCEPFLMLAICFLLGLSAVAQPAEYLIPVFHGFGTGITLTGIYDVYSADGIGMCAVMIIPGTIISAFAVIIAAREALNMSSEICLSSFGKNIIGAKIDFKLYFTKYVILCVIAAIGAFAESAFVFLFADFWQL